MADERGVTDIDSGFLLEDIQNAACPSPTQRGVPGCGVTLSRRPE
jgi:hypothetical protein